MDYYKHPGPWLGAGGISEGVRVPPGAECKQPRKHSRSLEDSACRPHLGREHGIKDLHLSPWEAQRITDLEKMSCGAGEFYGNTALFVASKEAERRGTAERKVVPRTPWLTSQFL